MSEICRVNSDLNAYMDYCDNLEKNKGERLAYIRDMRQQFKKSLWDGLNKQTTKSEIIDFIGDLVFDSINRYMDDNCEGDFDIFIDQYSKGNHQLFKDSIDSAVNRMADFYVGELE